MTLSILGHTTSMADQVGAAWRIKTWGPLLIIVREKQTNLENVPSLK